MKHLLLFFLLSVGAFAQRIQLSDTANSIVNQIAEGNLLEGPAVGYSGIPGPQYLLYENLRAQTTKKQIKSLLKHPNTTVKCYAFWAIVEDGDKNEIFTTIKQNMFDENSVETQFGCVVNTQTVGDVFLLEVYREYKPILDSIQIQELNKLLLYSNSKVTARNYAIKNLKPLPAYYKRIKQIATTENNGQAVVKLSKYKNKEDYGVIHKFYKSISTENTDDLYFFYKAVANIPHSSFFPILRHELNKTFSIAHYNDIWAEMYSAIAAYKNNEAARLLAGPFTSVEHNNMMSYHLSYIVQSIMQHKHSLYDSILWKIMDTYPQVIDIEPYEYLIQLDKQKTYLLTKKAYGISTHKVINEINYNPDDYTDLETINDYMLYFLFKNEPDEAFQYIKRAMQTTKTGLGTYFRLIKKIKSTDCVEVLFKRLETEDNIYYIQSIVQILLSYKDNAVNEKIYAYKKINPNLKFESLDEFNDKD